MRWWHLLGLSPAIYRLGTPDRSTLAVKALTLPTTQLRGRIMRNLFLMAAMIAGGFATVATAQVQVRGYVRKDGTYVAPHVRSAPNNTTLDNYSTKGNVNPYNGRQGTVDAYPSYPTSTYQPRNYNPPRTSTYEPYKPKCYFNCDN
jgi:hypothetical protein